MYFYPRAKRSKRLISRHTVTDRIEMGVLEH